MIGESEYEGSQEEGEEGLHGGYVGRVVSRKGKWMAGLSVSKL